MTNKQNDQLFNSIFGEVVHVETTIDLNGKTYKVKGYGTPPCTDEPLNKIVISDKHTVNTQT